MPRILIIDDDEKIRSSLKSALERREYSVVTAENFTEGKKFAQADFDVIFLDIILPDGNGLELLRYILSKNPNQVVVMISGQSDIQTAIEAIKSGAYDFIEKPISLDRILITIDNAVKTGVLLSEKERLEAIVYGAMVGKSDAILKLQKDITRSAPRTTRFLVTGENGTGKELVANMIHRHSRFPEGPFVAVNCAALPSELIESELFGHTTGAFTGAAKARKGKFVEADNGSILLDEISEMPLEAQAKILRVVETKTVNPIGSNTPIKVECNIIAATNRDLNQLVAEEKFRQDLLYRLNVVQFHIPSLRERKDDIILLSEHFLKQFAVETKTTVKHLSDDAKDVLLAFDFPGNIRELKNLIERINIYCEDKTIRRTDLEEFVPYIPKQKMTNIKKATLEFEAQFIKSAIARNDGNISKAAKELGLERSHLYKKMKKFEK